MNGDGLWCSSKSSTACPHALPLMLDLGMLGTHINFDPPLVVESLHSDQWEKSTNQPQNLSTSDEFLQYAHIAYEIAEP